MTTTLTNPTAGERHMVVVASPRLPQAVEELLAAAHVQQHAAAGCLMAIGAAGALARQGAAVAAVVVPASLLNGQTAAFADALHQIAPALRVIAVDAGEQQAAALRGSGVDHVLAKEADAGAWHQALGIAAQVDSSPTRNSQLETRNLPSCVLDELVNPGGKPREAAMHYAREASGFADLTITALADVAPGGHTGVEVAFPPYRFGLLHAPPPADEAALTPWARWLARVFALHRQQQDLWHMAMHDELTGAWNRRYFQRFLRLVLDRAAADQLPVTLMIFDIDNFKQYNDRHGHGAGDDILRETVKLLQSLVRKDDVVARIGGDEFAVIYWDPHGPRRADSKPPADVVKAAERFRKAISQHRFPKLAGAPGMLTVSAGLASFPCDGATPDELIARADAMAMQSKQQGKNALTFGSA